MSSRDGRGSQVANVVVFGTGQWAEIAHFYLTHDSPHEVAALTLDGDHIEEREHLGLPVVAFEEVEEAYPPERFEMFIPIGFTRMNHLRAEKYHQAKEKGYQLVSYVSSKATTWPGFSCGENCFIFEDNTIQPFVNIGNNVVLWSGNHIGHHSTIKDHVMVSSHVVISGNCIVESYCFLGVNATLRDGITLSRDTLVGAGALILRDTKEYELYKAAAAAPAKYRSDQIRKI
jgi:sugar O-acyltransferase (sialic acid O-acetyltransferase NeuD family)